MSNNSTNRIPSSIDEIDLKELYFYLKEHKWFIAAFAAATLFLGILYSFTLTPMFSSSALIQVDAQSSAGSMQQLLGSMGSIFTNGEQPASIVDVETALINSRYILVPAIKQLGLNISASPRHFPIIGSTIARHHGEKSLASPWFGMSRYAWGGEKIHVAQFDVPDEYEGKLFYLKAEEKNHYSIYMKNGDFLLRGTVGKLAQTPAEIEPQIKISVTELKANSGTQFLLVHTPIENSVEALSSSLSIIDIGSKNRSKTGVLQVSLKGANVHTLPAILNTVVDFTVQKNIEKKSAEATSMLGFLNKQLPIVRKSMEEAEFTLNRYRAQSGSIDMTSEAKILLTQLSNIEQEIEESKLKKAELLQDVTPEHPFVVTLVQRQLQLDKEAQFLKDKIKLLPASNQKAITLQREVRVKEQLYGVILNKIQQTEVMQGGTLSDVRVLDAATIPRHPLSLHRSLIWLSSLMAGFILAVGVLFLRKLAKKGIDDPYLVEEKLGITALAIIPYSKKQAEIARRIKANQTYDVAVLAQMDPKDISVEAIRSLRTALQFSLMGAKNNIISIMGTSPGIGKSFVSVNLAQVLVDSGKRVLLIDADMRKGIMCKYFGLSAAPGLSELLSKQAQVQTVVKNVAKGMDFIATGKYPPNPSELLSRSELQVLLDQFSREYDLVVIDNAPVLAVTDGVIVAQKSATNLMVIGVEADNMNEITVAANRIKQNGIELNGLVFNIRSESKAMFGQNNYYYAYESETADA